MNFKVLIFMIAAIGVSVSIYTRDQVSETKTLPVLGHVNHFSLQDSNNQVFETKQLDGQVWLANFFFTSCKGICPTIMGSINTIKKKTDNESPMQFVSITVDPARDNPAKLRKYKKRFTSGDTNWHYLTGDKIKIDNISEGGFQLAAATTADAHSQRVVLIDQNGDIRGYYNGMDPEVVNKVMKDIELLAKSRS